MNTNTNTEYEYLHSIYPLHLMLIEEQRLKTKLFVTSARESPKFDYFLFGINYYLNELNQVNILGAVL